MAVTAGTFSEGTSTLTMSGAATTVRFTAPRQPYNLVISAAGTVSIDTDDLTVGNQLTVNSGADLNTGGRSLSITANLVVAGTLTATGAETITVGGNVDFSAAGDNFTQASSTLTLSGAATPATIDATGEGAINNLTIAKSAGANVVRLLTGLALASGSGALTLTTGTLELNGQTLTLGTNFTLNSANATLTIGTGSFNGATNARSRHPHHRHGHPDHRHPERRRADS